MSDRAAPRNRFFPALNRVVAKDAETGDQDSALVIEQDERGPVIRVLRPLRGCAGGRVELARRVAALLSIGEAAGISTEDLEAEARNFAGAGRRGE